MTPDALRRVLVRDLRALATELDAYPDDASVWARPTGIENSAGTLILHLTGNLRHFVGARLGGSPYVRDREGEFAARDLSRAELHTRIAAAIEDVERALRHLDPSQVTGEFPDAVGGIRLPVSVFLLHLVAHCGYHLGQLDYHRRMVTANPRGVGVLSPAALAQ